MNNKPWDARLAAWLVAPLVDTAVSPNMLTTVRLVVGALGAVYFAQEGMHNLAGFLIVLSNFLDHTDGELARMSGKSSRFGHNYDLISDAVVTIGMFFGIGVGLSEPMGGNGPIFGVIAGCAVAGIFHLRNLSESRHGKSATRQPRLGGFEAEDILYLIPVVTLTGNLEWFLIAAAVGAPLALVIVATQYFSVESRARGDA